MGFIVIICKIKFAITLKVSINALHLFLSVQSVEKLHFIPSKIFESCGSITIKIQNLEKSNLYFFKSQKMTQNEMVGYGNVPKETIISCN